MPNNEWFEYDVTDEQGNTFTHTAESADTAAAIQSLLDMQQQSNSAGTKAKVTVQKSSSVDIGQLSDQLNQQQFYTIEQAMTLLNQSEKDQATATYIQSETDTVSAGQGLDDSDEILTGVPLSMASDMSEGQAITLTSQQKSTADSADLDPQTGMFYVEKGGSIGSIKINPDGQHVIVSSSEADAKGKYDLLSSSLAQAQIDLDPFQFIENGSSSSSVEKTTGSTVVHKAQSSEPGKLYVKKRTMSIISFCKFDMSKIVYFASMI